MSSVILEIAAISLLAIISILADGVGVMPLEQIAHVVFGQLAQKQTDSGSVWRIERLVQHTMYIVDVPANLKCNKHILDTLRLIMH